MQEFPDIIDTEIITARWDEFWKNIPGIDELAPKDVLVLSGTFEPGSAEETQLSKILAACNLTVGDYNLIPVPDGDLMAWYRLREQLKPKHVILFGVSPEQLGVSVYFMPHQVNRFNDASWIPTLSLQELEQNPDVKKHLWNYGLKPVFVEKAYG